MSSDELPLPYGWVKEFDSRTDHPFYVDTKADPPRAIWVHPYEDEQYLSEHPDVREKVGKTMHHDERPAKPRRHSFSGTDSADMTAGEASSAAAASQKGKHKRGFFGKMKDKAIGTKEEREAYKRELARQEQEERKQRELYRQEVMRRQQARYAQQPYYGPQQAYASPYGYAGPSSSRYGPPAGDPYANYGPYGSSRRGYGGGGFGGGGGSGLGMGLPVLGALAGGLLLGDILF
ncbi:hypothetical protein DENSPDRAFT_856965 [Dentipellis sp. KUC8613]|nr:hypothetical protein DENSPDRAFT_856965 [Dentipellis sp. KUC8613]